MPGKPTNKPVKHPNLKPVNEEVSTKKTDSSIHHDGFYYRKVFAERMFKTAFDQFDQHLSGPLVIDKSLKRVGDDDDNVYFLTISSELARLGFASEQMCDGVSEEVVAYVSEKCKWESRVHYSNHLHSNGRVISIDFFIDLKD